MMFLGHPVSYWVVLQNAAEEKGWTTLLAHIEALEQALRQIAEMKNDMSADGEFTAGDAYYAQALALVALREANGG